MKHEGAGRKTKEVGEGKGENCKKKIKKKRLKTYLFGLKFITP